VVISTDHDNIDWNILIDNATLIIDTRNALKDFDEEVKNGKIFKA